MENGLKTWSKYTHIYLLYQNIAVRQQHPL